MPYLSEYEEIDGGYVAFRGDPKGGKITVKGKIRTDTKCVVLSPDFKLLDDSQVLRRVPRKNNMYSVDLKNVAPSRDSQMHNNIMAAGSRDCPPMLAPERYPQWRSRFLRYVDKRPNGETLRKCILSSPYKPTTVLLLSKQLIILQHFLSTRQNANPLALVATAQASQDLFYQSSRSHRSSAPSPKPSIPSKSHTSTRHKGKEIAKPITPPSETASEEDKDPEQAQRDKDMQKNLALIAKYFKNNYKPTNNNLRTSSNSKNKNVDMTPQYKNDDHSGQFGTQRTVNVASTREKLGSHVVQKSGIQCFNCKEYGHFAKEYKKPKRVKDSVYHKGKMLLCKQAEQSFPLQAEQYDCNTCLVEADDSNVTPNSPDMCEDDIQNDQNDVEIDDERVTLANLIANLKLDVDEIKKIQKQLKKANTTLD
nr:ribonuclease H-like domain-containing protein [Tanacetum cinerariifolium]